MTGTFCTVCMVTAAPLVGDLHNGNSDSMTGMTRRFNANAAAIFPDRKECIQM